MRKLNICVGLFLLLLFAGVVGCNAFSPSDGKSEQIEFIANGWMICVKADGSAGVGRIKESNAIFSTASASVGAVNFEKIKKALDADFSSSNSVQFESPLVAAIRQTGQESVAMKPVRNIEIWNRLIEQLEPKWESVTLPSFKNAVEKDPLKLESAKK